MCKIDACNCNLSEFNGKHIIRHYTSLSNERSSWVLEPVLDGSKYGFLWIDLDSFCSYPERAQPVGVFSTTHLSDL